MHHRAVIHIPQGYDLDAWLPACVALADLHHWRVEAIIRDWDVLVRDLADRPGIGIVATEAHLPRLRLPRIEIADRWRPPESGRRPVRLR